MLVNDPSYTTSKGTILRKENADEEHVWRDGQKTTVQMLTIDDLEKDHPSALSTCNFMKIDIEGGEKIVIPAIQAYLQKQKPVLYLSLHWMYLEKEDIEHILRILQNIYPYIYDESLRKRLTLADILTHEISSIVCMPKDFTTLKKTNVHARYHWRQMKRRARATAAKTYAAFQA